jgi:hypothetical protein
MHIGNLYRNELRLILSFLVIFTWGIFSCSVIPNDKSPLYTIADAKNTQVFKFVGGEAIIESPYDNPKWFYSIPLPLDYDNTQCARSPCIQQIKYREIELSGLAGKRTIHLDKIPQLNRLGTHNIVIKAQNKLSHLQIIVRRDDTYVGYLTELIGVPFVYAPTLTTGGHQTDQRLGADCVALLIYGKLRQGYAIPYVAPPKLYDYTIKLGDSKHLSDIAIAEGDILHFGFQTAVISVDNPPRNILSDNDMVIHTFHKFAEEVPFAELPYKSSKFDVLRWDLYYKPSRF